MSRNATLAQRDKLWEVIDQDGTPRDQVQKFLASGLLPDFLHADYSQQIDRDELRRILHLKPLEYEINVNYGLPISEAMMYDGTGSSNCAIVDRNFPTTRTGKASMKAILFKIKRGWDSNKIIAQMDKQGLRPADLRELLAFGRRYPALVRERRFHMIALGATYQSHPLPQYPIQVCALTLEDYPKDEISLSLLLYDEEWTPDDCRFLAVPK